MGGYGLTDKTMNYVLNLQGDIAILSKRAHDIEKFLKSKPVIVENNCEKHLVEANTNSAAYTPNTKLYWSTESGIIMSKAEWNKEDSCDRLEYIGTAGENGYEFKDQCNMIDSQHDGEILRCNHISALTDCIMECFIFHKLQRRSRI